MNDGDLTVVLDTNLTEELLAEGFQREVVSKVQTMRKEADFNVTDHISVTYQGSEKADALIGAGKEAIASDILADDIRQGEPESGAYVKEWNVNGETVTFGIRQV